MCRTKYPIHLVISRHQGPWVAVSDSDLERLEGDFAKGTVWDLFVDKETACLLIIGYKMLDAGANAGFLDGVDELGSKFASQEGVFAVGFKIATAKGGSGDADWYLLGDSLP